MLSQITSSSSGILTTVTPFQSNRVSTDFTQARNLEQDVKFQGQRNLLSNDKLNVTLQDNVHKIFSGSRSVLQDLDKNQCF